MEHITKYGTASAFQKKNRILVSTLAAYGGREEPRGFGRLKESCDKFGVEISCLGSGTLFVDMFQSKLAYVGQCLWDLRNDYDYVISLDSADTLFLRALDTDFPFSERMVFMSERNCFPIEEMRDKFPSVGSSYKFLNAGGFHGKMQEVVKTFAYMAYKRAMLTTPEYSSFGFASTFTDDQAAWCAEALLGNVSIDYKCQFAQTLWGVDLEDDVAFLDGGLINLEHNSKPYILHANGSAAYSIYYDQLIRNA